MAAAALAVSAPVSAERGEVTIEVVEENDGTRTLVHEAVIDAPVAEVWKVLSTRRGMDNVGSGVRQV